MGLNERYQPQNWEPQIAAQWSDGDIYRFHPDSDLPIFSIDTPPPTVSGNLHLGHAYSYSQTDIIARYRRMRGYNVFYPIGFDDNGLPTERLVEYHERIVAAEVGRQAFIERCLAISEEMEAAYEQLFARLGLSVDWQYRYRTISRESRRLAQWSFLDLYRRELVYRQQAPVIWCPTCGTALAQADVEDRPRETKFYTLAFALNGHGKLSIATTRPELLPACVAIFIHPDNPRASDLLGCTARVPLFDREVPIFADEAVDPRIGTGIVMCCTFGDTTDVEWWRKHDLPLVSVVGQDGAMTESAGRYAGKTILEARNQIVNDLCHENLLQNEWPASQTVRVHERCDTAVEFIVSRQWFVSLLPQRQSLLEAGRDLDWYPEHMHARYEQWVTNLGWDWCISRQRAFGVPFPVWYCETCGAIRLASEDALPIDPSQTDPPGACSECGGNRFLPETDVMDTWATSSLTPQIAGRALADPGLYHKVFPYSMRPQAHEIIRTWAFYTMAKSQYHFQSLPWHDIAISGWGLAPEGAGKISKSRGGGPIGILDAIERYSADAVRYWAGSTAFGKDSVIDERKMQAGVKLANKLWNVARFSQRFLESGSQAMEESHRTPADRWIHSRAQRLIQRTTTHLESYDYATAKSEIEAFFWTELADNYLEMAKKRLYDGGDDARGARETLRHLLMTTLKLLAPYLPFVTDAIYRQLFSAEQSIHNSAWPMVQPHLIDRDAERIGETLLFVATTVRRFKSDTNLSLGMELSRLHLSAPDRWQREWLREAEVDIVSITRAQTLTIGDRRDPALQPVGKNDVVDVALAL